MNHFQSTNQYHTMLASLTQNDQTYGRKCLVVVRSFVQDIVEYNVEIIFPTLKKSVELDITLR